MKPRNWVESKGIGHAKKYSVDVVTHTTNQYIKNYGSTFGPKDEEMKFLNTNIQIGAPGNITRSTNKLIKARSRPNSPSKGKDTFLSPKTMNRLDGLRTKYIDPSLHQSPS